MSKSRADQFSALEKMFATNTRPQTKTETSQPPSKNRIQNVLELPDELLLHTFSFLGYRALREVGLVNKRLLSISKTDALVKKFEHVDIGMLVQNLAAHFQRFKENIKLLAEGNIYLKISDLRKAMETIQEGEAILIQKLNQSKLPADKKQSLMPAHITLEERTVNTLFQRYYKNDFERKSLFSLIRFALQHQLIYDVSAQIVRCKEKKDYPGLLALLNSSIDSSITEEMIQAACKQEAIIELNRCLADTIRGFFNEKINATTVESKINEIIRMGGVVDDNVIYIFFKNYRYLNDNQAATIQRLLQALKQAGMDLKKPRCLPKPQRLGNETKNADEIFVSISHYADLETKFPGLSSLLKALADPSISVEKIRQAFVIEKFIAGYLTLRYNFKEGFVSSITKNISDLLTELNYDPVETSYQVLKQHGLQPINWLTNIILMYHREKSQNKSALKQLIILMLKFGFDVNDVDTTSKMSPLFLVETKKEEFPGLYELLVQSCSASMSLEKIASAFRREELQVLHQKLNNDIYKSSQYIIKNVVLPIENKQDLIGFLNESNTLKYLGAYFNKPSQMRQHVDVILEYELMDFNLYLRSKQKTVIEFIRSFAKQYPGSCELFESYYQTKQTLEPSVQRMKL